MGWCRASVGLRVSAPVPGAIPGNPLPSLVSRPQFAKLRNEFGAGPGEWLSSGEWGVQAGGGVSQLAHSWASRSQAGCQREEGAEQAVSRGSLGGCRGVGADPASQLRPSWLLRSPAILETPGWELGGGSESHI